MAFVHAPKAKHACLGAVGIQRHANIYLIARHPTGGDVNINRHFQLPSSCLLLCRPPLLQLAWTKMALHARSDSQVLAVLSQTRKDMWNAELGYMAFLLSPTREFILDPTFALWGIILPPLTCSSHRFDTFFATMLYMWLFPVRLFYATPKETTIDLRRNAKNDIIINNKAGLRLVPQFKPPSDVVSAFRGALAFLVSATADLISTIMDRNKMSKWFEAVMEFKAYLDISGIGSELDEAFMKPLLRGRLLDNLKILNDVQEIMYAERGPDMNECSVEELEVPILEGKRMMRFATAAYGTEMIRSALDREANHKQLESQTKAIAFHCGIDAKDIRVLYIDDGGDMKVLRHFVAIDRETKSVVLALRGTLSISGALVDMQGMDADYCCGQAHKGIAEMADNVWNESGDEIVALFDKDQELKDYTFVITGHSLGAGTSCLLNIKCHLEKPLGNRPIKCFGFAPPPTFCFDDSFANDPDTTSSIQKAIDNCLCYIHDNDCVPLLSVQCIRRFADLMDTVDNKTEHMWAPKRFKLFWEWEPIPQDICEAVERSEKERVTTRAVVQGASKLVIPAKVVIWMKKSFAGFDAFGCSPSAVADMNIFCCEDMISDHMPEAYEDALDELAG